MPLSGLHLDIFPERNYETKTAEKTHNQNVGNNVKIARLGQF